MRSMAYDMFLNTKRPGARIHDINLAYVIAPMPTRIKHARPKMTLFVAVLGLQLTPD